MYQSNNKILFLFEQTEQSDLKEIKIQLGNLYDVFLERRFLLLTNEVVKFSYTGIAANATNVFCILPKYLSGRVKTDRDYLFHARQLIKVLKIYQNNIDLDIPDSEITDYSSHAINSEISIADFILNDYLQNGLWSTIKKNITNSSENEILWDYTIDNSYAVVSKYPYYFDLYSSENLWETNNLISKIHRWAIKYCNDKYSELLDINTDIVEELVYSLEDLGEKNYLLNAIEKELRITFNDRNISLLKALSELISATGSNADNVYTLYGKNKFEHIWEAGISYCFKNQYSTYKRFLSAPIWKNNLGTVVSEKHTVKPDVLRWVLNEEKSVMLIIDAKYYMFNFDEINMIAENNPGVGDIIKQYFYELILSRNTSGAEWLYHSTEYINLLMFPNSNATGPTIEINGSVSIDNSALNKSIINVYINPTFLFDSYIKQRPYSDEQISQLINEAKKVLGFDAK